jgi:cell envelope opacity-associated protein A
MVDIAEEDEEGADEDRTNPGRQNKNKNVTDENVWEPQTKPHKKKGVKQMYRVTH